METDKIWLTNPASLRQLVPTDNRRHRQNSKKKDKKSIFGYRPLEGAEESNFWEPQISVPMKTQTS